MKMTYNPKTDLFSIEDITGYEVNVLFAVLSTADKRCFTEQDENGNWYSNDDFVLTLNEQEREILSNTGKFIHHFYYGK